LVVQELKRVVLGSHGGTLLFLFVHGLLLCFKELLEYPLPYSSGSALRYDREGLAIWRLKVGAHHHVYLLVRQTVAFKVIAAEAGISFERSTAHFIHLNNALITSSALERGN
jgi:hypothetical protein